jgi:hypothetical protein
MSQLNKFRVLLFVMTATTGIASALVLIQDPDHSNCTPCKVEKQSHSIAKIKKHKILK